MTAGLEPDAASTLNWGRFYESVWAMGMGNLQTKLDWGLLNIYNLILFVHYVLKNKFLNTLFEGHNV
jgi:hypothetical protein